jgi:pimeloyl-ACP methyl ester carboxylesterase
VIAASGCAMLGVHGHRTPHPHGDAAQDRDAPGLAFDVLIDGPEDAPLVLLLHGFAESFHMWRAQLAALAAARYRAIAPSQRGYSAGARPPTNLYAEY